MNKIYHIKNMAIHFSIETKILIKYNKQNLKENEGGEGIIDIKFIK